MHHLMCKKEQPVRVLFLCLQPLQLSEGYADDVVEYFVQKSAANGIDIIRIFDCLNDMRTFRQL